jgi:Lipase (class 3)
MDEDEFVRGIDLESNVMSTLSVLSQKPYHLSIAGGESGIEKIEEKDWEFSILKKTIKKKNGTSAEEIEGVIYHNDVFGTVIAMRGTKYKKDWGTNLDFAFTDFAGNTGKVHRGFYRMLNEIEGDLCAKLTTMGLFDGAKNKPVYFIGHSRGGALATLAAAKIFSTFENLHSHQVKVITFSSPRVGNREFVNDFHRKVGRDNIITFYCNTDLVPGAPLESHGFYDHGLSIQVDWGQQTWGQAAEQWFRFLRKVEESEEDEAPFNYADIEAYSNRFLDKATEMYGTPRTAASVIINHFIRISHEVPTTHAIELALEDYKYDFRLGLPLKECGRACALFSFKKNPWLTQAYKLILG